MMRRSQTRWRRILPGTLLLALALSACGRDGGLTGVPRLEAPRGVEASYQWVLQRWENGEPRGQPSVQVSWELPSGWRGEPFRVYARRSGGSYVRVATVTSCGEGVCSYTDLNVVGGQRYDYYVAAVDEESGREVESVDVAQVLVPTFSVPAGPTAVRAVGLDGAVYLAWEPSGAQRYRVLLESDDPGQPFDVGETDGTSFVDDRAQNGVVGQYYVVAIDTLGHFGRLGTPVTGIARPDYHAELVYPHEVNATESGFRFVASPQSESPIVPGGSTSAQWRLETVDGVRSLVPLGETRVTRGVFTSALSCGPESDPDCVAVETAPSSAEFGATAAAVEAGYTYVFRVRGSDGRTRFGKVRALGVTTDSQSRPVLVFDWAYQLVADEPRLNRVPG